MSPKTIVSFMNGLLFVDGLLSSRVITRPNRCVASDARGVCVGVWGNQSVSGPAKRFLSSKLRSDKDYLDEHFIIDGSLLHSGYHPIIKDWLDRGMMTLLPTREKSCCLYEVEPRVWDALMFFRGYFEAIEDSTESKSILGCYDSLRAQIQPLSELWGRNLARKDQIQVFKYWTVWPMWKWISRDKSLIALNPPPKKPAYDWLKGQPFTGKLRQFIRNQTCSSSNRSARFCWTLFQGVKRSANVVPIDFFKDSLADHLIALTQSPPALDPHIMDSCKVLTAELAQRINLRLDFREKQVSSSATFSTQRRRGGGLSELLNKFSEPSPVFASEDPLHEPGILSGQSGVSFRDILTDRKNHVHGGMKVVPLAEPLKVRVITAGEGSVTHFGRVLQAPLRSGLAKLDIFRLTGQPVDSETIQNLILRAGLFWECFHPSDDMCIVSGDYKAATDGLNIQVTLSIFDSLMAFLFMNDEYMSEGIESILRMNLEDIELTYPSYFTDLVEDSLKRGETTFAHIERRVDPTGKTVVCARMRNGQLMGSIVSFPLLCIANLASYFDALLRFFNDNPVSMGKSWGLPMIDIEESEILYALLEMGPLLINGDDILFYAPVEFVSYWRDSASKLGFSLSPGKNYVHRSHCTVNSRLFSTKINCPSIQWWYHIYDREIHWCLLRKRQYSLEHFVTSILTHTDTQKLSLVQVEELNYLNLGLLLPSPPELDKVPVKSLDDCFNEVMKGSMNPSRTSKRYIHYHRKLIERLSSNGKLQLALPKELGGLGFNDLPGARLTLFQTRLGSQLYNRYVHLEDRLISSTEVDDFLPSNKFVTGSDSEAPRFFRERASKFLMVSRGAPVVKEPATVPNQAPQSDDKQIHFRPIPSTTLRRLVKKKNQNGQLHSQSTLQSFDYRVTSLPKGIDVDGRHKTLWGSEVKAPKTVSDKTGMSDLILPY